MSDKSANKNDRPANKKDRPANGGGAPVKKILKPGAVLSPVPAVLVSCASSGEQNLITIAWTGIINSDPPLTYVSVRKSRHSHDMIADSGCFVINLVTEDLVRAADWCGVKSGRDFDKFRECGLTAVPASEVEAPLVAESPINLECRVIETHEYPTHDMFVGEIVAVHCDESLLDEEGRMRSDLAGLVSYIHGEYFGLRKHPLGRFGYSVMKPSTRRRLNREKQEKRAAEASRGSRRQKESGRKSERSSGKDGRRNSERKNKRREER